jgi:hypothetical protein
MVGFFYALWQNLEYFCVDKLVEFFDTFTLIGIICSSILYCFWKNCPHYVETLYYGILYSSVGLDTVLIIGSLCLNFCIANFKYQFVHFCLNTYITFVQIYGVLVFYKTLENLNTHIFIGGICVFVIHQLVFGLNHNIHTDFKSTIAEYIEIYFGVKDNSREVISRLNLWCLNLLQYRADILRQ